MAYSKVVKKVDCLVSMKEHGQVVMMAFGSDLKKEHSTVVVRVYNLVVSTKQQKVVLKVYLEVERLDFSMVVQKEN